MKILLYGDGASPGSGGWCYAESLVEMGHTVIRVGDTEALGFYANTISGRAVKRLLGKPLEKHRQRHVTALIQSVDQDRPDIVIILKGLHLTARDVAAMRRLGAWVVIINHDDFFSYNRNNWSEHQRGAIPHYDFVFVTREVNVAEIAPLNPRVELFPFAYFPRIHRPVEIPAIERDLWGVDAVFVGTWEQERCSLLEDLVVRVPARYSVWGTGWNRWNTGAALRPFLHRQAVMVDEMAKAIGGAAVTLAFLRKKNRDDYTQRTFEIPACGGLMLAERSARHMSYYREGIEAEFFDPNDADELVGKMRALLADPVRRQILREAGRNALLSQRHTYRDRLERLLELHRTHQARAHFTSA